MNLATIAQYLPTIATALVNPVAGVASLAAQFLGPKLNVASTVEAVTQKLAGMSPEDMVKMKELDVQLQTHLSDNGIEMARLEQELDKGEQEINKIEAQSNRGPWLDLFVAGWRPYLGWVGGFGISYQFMVRPILNGIVFLFGGSYAFPALEIQDLIALVTLLLGHSAMRSFDKKNGVSNGS